MTPHGIPVIQPIPYLNGDPMGVASAQPIIQFKELARDEIRWQCYQAWIAQPRVEHNQQIGLCGSPGKATFTDHEQRAP